MNAVRVYARNTKKPQILMYGSLYNISSPIYDVLDFLGAVKVQLTKDYRLDDYDEFLGVVRCHSYKQ